MEVAVKTEKTKITLAHPLDREQTVEFFVDLTLPESNRDNEEIGAPHGSWNSMAASWFRALETTKHRELKRRELQGKYNLKGELAKVGCSPTEAIDLITKIKALSPEQRKALGL